MADEDVGKQIIDALEPVLSRSQLSQSDGSAIAGAIEVGFSFLTGTAFNPETKGQGQFANDQQVVDELRKLVQLTQNADQRIPNMLQAMGDVAGSPGAGRDMSNVFKGLPPFVKNIVQTMVNNTALGGLTGGDPRAIAMGAMSAAKKPTAIVDPTGMGGLLGGDFSPQRTAMAADINESIMGHFQDPQTGMPIRSRMQGMQFEHLGKLMGRMSEAGGIKAGDLVEEVSGGGMSIDSKKMADVKGTLKDGMELLRNISDVFGSRDFSELMTYAERVAGLDVSDPSSLKRSLHTVRNARGIARAVGMDERRALGMIAQNNEVMMSMGGVDRRVAAAMTNTSFSRNALQGAMNAQAQDPFDQGIYRKQDTTENLMKDQTVSDLAMMQEAQQNPDGTAAQTIGLRLQFDKNKHRFDEQEQESIEKALRFRGPEAEKRELLGQAERMYEAKTGQNLSQFRRDMPIKNQLEVASGETAAAVAQDTRALTESRNVDEFSGRLTQRYVPQYLSLDEAERRVDKTGKQGGFAQDPALEQQITDLKEKRAKSKDATEREVISTTIADLEEKQQFTGEEHRENIAGFQKMLTQTRDIGRGGESIAKILGIAGGEEGMVTFTDSDGKSKKMNARDMSRDQRRAAIKHELVSYGSFADDPEQDARIDETIDRAMNFAKTSRELKDSGIIDLGGSRSVMNMFEAMGVDPQMMSMRISRYAERQGQISAEQGGKMFAGPTAASNPLLSALYGAMEGNAQTAFDATFEAQKKLGFKTGEIGVNDLTMTGEQRGLFGEVSETLDPEKRAAIFAKDRSKGTALDDFEQRILPALEEFNVDVVEQDEDGQDVLTTKSLTDVAGVTKEQIKEFRKQGDIARKAEDAGENDKAAQARAAQLDVFTEISSQLGGEEGKMIGLFEELRKQGVLIKTKKADTKDVDKAIEDAGGAEVVEDFREHKLIQNRLDRQQKIKEQKQVVEEMEGKLPQFDDQAQEKADAARKEKGELQKKLDDALPEAETEKLLKEKQRIEQNIQKTESRDDLTKTQKDSFLSRERDKLAGLETQLDKVVTKEEREQIQEQIKQKDTDIKKLETSSGAKEKRQLKTERAKLQRLESDDELDRKEQEEFINEKISRISDKKELTKEDRSELRSLRTQRGSEFESAKDISEEIRTLDKERKETKDKEEKKDITNRITTLKAKSSLVREVDTEIEALEKEKTQVVDKGEKEEITKRIASIKKTTQEQIQEIEGPAAAAQEEVRKARLGLANAEAMPEGGGLDRKAALARISEMQESGELSDEEATSLAKDVFDKESEDRQHSDPAATAASKRLALQTDRMRAKAQGITVKELREQRAERIEAAGLLSDDGAKEEAVQAAKEKVEAAKEDLARAEALPAGETMPEALAGDWDELDAEDISRKMQDPKYKKLIEKYEGQGKTQLEIENIIEKVGFADSAASVRAAEKGAGLAKRTGTDTKAKDPELQVAAQELADAEKEERRLGSAVARKMQGEEEITDEETEELQAAKQRTEDARALVKEIEEEKGFTIEDARDQVKQSSTAAAQKKLAAAEEELAAAEAMPEDGGAKEKAVQDAKEKVAKAEEKAGALAPSDAERKEIDEKVAKIKSDADIEIKKLEKEREETDGVKKKADITKRIQSLEAKKERIMDTSVSDIDEELRSLEPLHSKPTTHLERQKINKRVAELEKKREEITSVDTEIATLEEKRKDAKTDTEKETIDKQIQTLEEKRDDITGVSEEDKIGKWLERQKELVTKSGEAWDEDEEQGALEAIDQMQADLKEGKGGYITEIMSARKDVTTGDVQSAVEKNQELRDFERGRQVKQARTVQEMAKTFGIEKDKEIEEFLEAGGEKRLASGEITDARKKIFTEGTAIDDLTAGTKKERGTLIDKLDSYGMGKEEIMTGLDQARAETESQLAVKGKGALTGDARAEAEQRLDDIKAAKRNVAEHYGGEGGGLIGVIMDLMEKLDDFISHAVKLSGSEAKG